MISNSIVDTIGRTPLVRLRGDNKIVGQLYAKMEMLNPFGMKDRVAKKIILEAKKTGILKEGTPIIESSSGTMACGVALVGTLLGHEVHIVTDPRIDPITMAKLKSLGCHVHVVDKMGHQGWQSARLELLSQLMDELPNAFCPRQYENPNNPKAYEELSNELIHDLGDVDILIGAVGSGGSLSGSAKALKKYNADLKVIAVDSTGSVIFGQPDRANRLQGGLGNSLIAPNVQYSVMDEIHWLNDQEAFTATLELACKEKIFAGNSSGSVYAVARWIARQVSAETKIVAIFPDRGDRYTNTIYNEAYRKSNGIRRQLPSAPIRIEAPSVVESWSYLTISDVIEHQQLVVKDVVHAL
ncbi:PLP-dependent cysteine synthase family protein [Chengkuizengella axinellae]|uniref:Cysteine synthase family protein n=1 Tax=Chengkuizengella axinellae TaxID=3064388 RepID=A0ABT9J0D3_9BACL|nr:cysteine synthase family protein [Chengkuizengella sp. 2205SS18-9]MDP5274862.1 cysteine synthase family protein [Chengkuizengella sp. 2205SS18-9]